MTDNIWISIIIWLLDLLSVIITAHYQFFKSLFPPFLFGIYDNLISDYVPDLQKYDICMTEQVPGPQEVKIVGRHMVSAPKPIQSCDQDIWEAEPVWHDPAANPGRHSCRGRWGSSAFL